MVSAVRLDSSPQNVIGDGHAELGELLDVRANLLLAVEMRVVISAKVIEWNSAQHKVNRDSH